VTTIQIIGNKGSKSRIAISKGSNIKLYLGRSKPDIIINYGLTSKKLVQFFAKYPSARRIPMINKYVGCPKHMVIKSVEKAGILVPETRLTIPWSEKISDWIEKRIQSSQGYGIRRATHRDRIPGKYYQKMINDRLYELRVHAFLWEPIEDWVVSKRVGPANQIAWNFHQGGHFSSIKNPNKFEVFLKAKKISKKIIESQGMGFGGVDFIVDKAMNVYFIEVNSSPGFEALNQGVYVKAFSKLKNLSEKELKKYTQ
jgi:glutathione synthase/RimK-type ligase-like ATP-grasp enzyme